MQRKVEPLFRLGDRVEFINPYTVDRAERMTIRQIKRRGKKDFFYSKDGSFYIAETKLRAVVNDEGK